MMRKFVERIKMMIDDWEEFIEISKTMPPQSFRVNTWKADVDDVLERLGHLGLKKIPWYDKGFYVENYSRLGNTLEHFLGYIYIQDSASMIPPLLVKGHTILDMCAAPGSKTTQLSQDLKESIIIANDINIHRIKALQSNVSRLGCLNVFVTLYDGRNYPNIDVDSILLDAPCSSDGMTRRDNEFFSKWSMRRVYAFSRLQKSLISRAFELLPSGGELIYSTCTSSPEENELVIKFLLEKFDDAKLCTVDIDAKTRPGLTFWGEELGPEMKKCVRIWPQDNNTETFFIAKVKKL